ncbi:MAG: helix-turn-helix domain-containing protein [Desulfobulbaceae bacterium]|nr:helix-turn-helix domain-containing protein [Desulfobulbaceae bacterium]
MEFEKFFTEKETAQRLSIRESTLRAWRCRRKGPRFAKLHGAVRYPESGLREFLEKSMVPGG